VALAVGITMIFGGFLVAATPLQSPATDRPASAPGKAAGGVDGPAAPPRLTARTG
jgi:hypothetical protein